jgi:ATP-binding cassette subfamily B protein
VAQHNIDGAKQYILYFLATAVIGALIGAAGDLISLHSENYQYSELIMRYHAKLTGKDMAFYRDHQSGYLVTLFRQYLDSLLQLIRFIRHDLLRAVVSLVVPVFVLLAVNWRLGLIAGVVMIVQFVYVTWASAKINHYRARSHEIYRRVTGEVADTITNITAYKASGAEHQARDRLRQLSNEETEVFWQQRSRAVLYDLPRDLVSAAGITAAFWVAATSTDNFAASVGTIVLTVSYMFQIWRNVSDLPNLLAQHDDYITKAYPTLEYLAPIHETVTDPARPRRLKITQGTIELDHVTFRYPGTPSDSRPVFEDLSLQIAGGEHIGIVGLSGAGKSTLINLLLRFDDVTAGTISIDGINIRNVAQTDLRSHIAYVPQEPLLFHRSIRENIAYFNATATAAAIEHAAMGAHAHSFIQALPHRYDSLVGERGVKLSGGQKQRIVIARAILKNAPIVIFDEATSALDSESEGIIQEALPEILQTHTAIVIAHRLSTVANLDRILVIHDGQIVESGTHKELLKRHGRYAQLWQKQTKSVMLPAKN